MFSEIRGKAGTFVASKNRTGVIIRNLVNPRNSVSIKRTGVRSSYSDIASAWRVMSSSDKLDWLTASLGYTFYNSLGVAYVPTAYQLFLSLNLRIQFLGVSPILTAQSYELLSIPNPSISEPLIGFETMNLDSWIHTSADEYLVLYFSDYIPSSTYRLSVPSKYAYNCIAATYLPVNLWDTLIALNGRAPLVGEYIFIYSIKVNSITGQVSLKEGFSLPCNA